MTFPALNLHGNDRGFTIPMLAAWRRFLESQPLKCFFWKVPSCSKTFGIQLMVLTFLPNQLQYLIGGLKHDFYFSIYWEYFSEGLKPTITVLLVLEKCHTPRSPTAVDSWTRFVVQMHWAFQTQGHLFLVLDYCSGTWWRENSWSLGGGCCLLAT